jgi:acetolactate synthase-1/2/3 large subunit
MDKAPQVKLHSTSHYFLDGLNDIGVEYLFSNFGTDHAPLIEEMARWKKSGWHYPKVLNCPHENTAMHMAAGFAQATGRGQAVMVHVDAGTANSAMAMHNARRGRLPLVLLAGKAPGRATTTCTSSRSRSTSRGSCAPTRSGSGRCPRA